jgi:lysophospholipase L1-like esterase
MSRRLAYIFALLLGAAALAATGCQPAPPPPACQVGVVGDSLTVGAQPYLGAAMSKKGCTVAWVDGRTSRPTSEGVAILEAHQRAGTLPRILIVGLGTNDRDWLGDFPGHVDRVMAIAAGRPVIWIDSAFGPVRDVVNGTLTVKAQQYPNLKIMSWDGPYWSTPSWRAGDNVHATAAGYQARANMMADQAWVVK